jgi:serine phosphatase RsbU (regulator of sigma subunit)
MLGISSLNEIVKSMGNCSAAFALDQLATRVRESLHQTAEVTIHSSIDGMDIALCSFNPATGLLQYAGANNNLYLVRGGEMKIYRADKQDIASKYQEPLPFTNHFIDTQAGDVIYLFSDGFPDQYGGPHRKKYKYGRFRKFLLDIHREPMQRQRELFGKELDHWMGEHEQIDDVLVMGIRIPPALELHSV